MGIRVLFTSPAGLGHIHPMVPLARAMAARGHDVLWAVPADGVEHVERAGLPAVKAGASGITRPADVMRRFPEIAALPPAQVPEVLFGKMFGAVAAPSILADLAPVALRWRPHLVVADAAEFAGHIMAAELGVPSVTKGFGPLLPERRVAAADVELAPLWRSRGLEPRPYGGSYDHLYLDIYPPALAGDDATHVPRRQPLRPLTDAGAADPSSPVPLTADRRDAPLVYVTMGTVFNDPEPLRVVLGGLADLDVRVVVTVGPRGDPAVLGPQPPHVRVERYVPQDVLLPLCGAVVSHAGSGTVLATLAEGLPQLCLPQGADQFLNARAVAASGAGLSLPPEQASAGVIGNAVARLLREPAFAHAAGRVAASIEAMPSPDEVAAVLETLPGSVG